MTYIVIFAIGALFSTALLTSLLALQSPKPDRWKLAVGLLLLLMLASQWAIYLWGGHK